MDAAWSHEGIVEAFRKQFGGLEPAHRRGVWESMPDDLVVLESICDHFDLRVRSGGGGKSDWAVQFVQRPNAVVTLYVRFREEPPIFDAYAVVANGDAAFAERLLEYLAAQLGDSDE